MTRLLISVRDADEALDAMVGGAALIDVKEPLRGPLGRADDATVAAVLDAVAGRVPVSAAMGELVDHAGPAAADGLAFLKWGLAGAAAVDWRAALVTLRDQSARVVPCAYADWRRAGAPTPRDVCHLAIAGRFAGLLIDTWRKDGTTLLDWLSAEEAGDIVAACQAAGLPVALAGSLSPRTARALRGTRPDWFAFRSAACDRGDRRGRISRARVAELSRDDVFAVPALPAC